MLEDKVAPQLVKPSVMIGLALAACSLFAVCCVFIANKSIGYRPAELAPADLHEHRAMEMLFDWFTFFPGYIVFKDVDVPSKQGEMLQLYDAVTRTSRAIPDAAPLFLTMFYNYCAAAQQQLGRPLLDPLAWNHTSLAPYGIASSNPESFYQLYNSWSSFPLNDPTKAYQPGGNTFVYADMVRANEFNIYNNTNRELEMSFFPFFQIDLKDDEAIVQAIKDVRSEIDNSPLHGKASPYGPIFTYWQVFIAIEPILWRILAINVSVIFITTLLVLQSPLAAVVSALACTMIVLELYGICMLFLKFNVFIAASLLAAAGMSVEFVAHVVAAFSLAQGTLEKRLATAMRHTFAAIILGSISTFVGILPMAFHNVPFVVKYQFAPFALAVGLGTLNGLVFLPAFLALIGMLSARLSKSSAGDGKEVKEPTTV